MLKFTPKVLVQAVVYKSANKFRMENLSSTYRCNISAFSPIHKASPWETLTTLKLTCLYTHPECSGLLSTAADYKFMFRAALENTETYRKLPIST